MKITVFDLDGNKTQIENDELIEKITKFWGKPSEVFMGKEAGDVWANIPEMEMQRVAVGWVHGHGRIELI